MTSPSSSSSLALPQLTLSASEEILFGYILSNSHRPPHICYKRIDNNCNIFVHGVVSASSIEEVQTKLDHVSYVVPVGAIVSNSRRRLPKPYHRVLKRGH